MSEQEKFYRVVDGYCTFCHGHDEHNPDCMLDRKVLGADMAKPGADKTAFMIGINGQNFEVCEEIAEQFSKHIRQLKSREQKLYELEAQMQSNDDAHLQVIQKCKEAIQLIYSHRGEDELVQQTFDPLLQNTLNIY